MQFMAQTPGGQQPVTVIRGKKMMALCLMVTILGLVNVEV